MTLTVPAILGLATGVPADRYSQAESYQHLERFLEPNPRARAIFRAARVAYRHSAATPDFYLTNPGTEARNMAYFAAALPLGEATVRRCLDSAGVPPEA